MPRFYIYIYRIFYTYETRSMQAKVLGENTNEPAITM